MIARIPHIFLQVRHFWPTQDGRCTVPVSSQGPQLSRRARLKPQLPRRYSQLNRSFTLLVTMAKPAANADTVRAEFSRAGIPDEVTAKLLKIYKPYLNWNPDIKLRPALQLWVKQLGSQQLSERLDKHPQLLCRTPDECNDVYLWLASLGVDAERIQQRMPRALARRLSDVQHTVWAIQHVLQLTDEQLPAFFKQHPYSLLYSPDRVVQTLQTVAELLTVPLASNELQNAIMALDQRLFPERPSLVFQRVSLFCKEFKVGQHAAKAALKQSIYRVPLETMRARAAELKALLGWTEDELNKALCTSPNILTKQPSTVANNMQKLQAHNFTSAQALSIYASRPALAGYDWNSPLNVEKIMYLSLVLQISTTELVSMYRLLVASLGSATGPRSEFLYRSRAVPCDVPLRQSKLSSYIVTGSDASFAARFNNPSASPPLMYDDKFKQHWQQRWSFLRHEMGLSTADISACRALLFTSLPNTLAPRWQFLTMLEAAQAGFKAANHLTALATLSDEHFAQMYNVMNVDLVYDRNSCSSLKTPFSTSGSAFCI